MRVLSRVVLGLILVVVSCAVEREPINRVQPNVVQKSWFTGDWYYMQTVIDTPYSTGFTMVGEQNYAERIEWEIQEEYLIARRTYEWITGSEPEGVAGATEEGVTVAMWEIDSHFDIRRQYNETTGEEINVIVENDTDRPWYEREYMRVDWSENLIQDADALSWARILEGIEARSVAYYVQDLEEGHPHRPKLVRDPQSGDLEYLDIVSKVFIEPTTVWDEWWGEIPSCWLLDQLYLDCVGAEITVRHSFLRVDESRDYQPWNYPGNRMERFGYFVTERPGHDPHYGVVDPVRNRFINRYDLWQRSHRRDAEGETIPCTTDSECDDGEGSVCDLDWGRAWGADHGICTIPYRQRELRPIVYYPSTNFPAEFMNELEHIRLEWNGSFVQTVGSLRENECLVTGGSAGDCAAERERDDAREILIFCHNPVIDEDPDACGPAGTTAEVGDLRYSLLAWVSEAHVYPPLGYGPSAVDPVTGETIQASVYVYGPEVEALAAYGRDLVSLLNGDLSQEEVANGVNVQRMADRLGQSERGRSERSAHDHVIPLDGGDAERINRAMDFSWMRGGRPAPERTQRRPGNLREALERHRGARDRIARRGAFGQGPEGGHARLARLRGSVLEADMTGPELRIAAGLDPSGPLDEAGFEQASPLRGQGLAWLRTQRRIQRQLQGSRCWMRADFADEGLLGLARAIQRAVERGDGEMEWYGVSYQLASEDGSVDGELVREMLRHPILESTLSHELGHTLGLRHNFMGSYDALNYHPEYWRLRDDGNMRPRAWDPITEAEIDGRIREYQTSSVMDYGNNFISTDAMGLGRYDIAAIKMGYGDLIEVFTNAEDAHEIAWINFMQIWEYPVVMREESYEEDGEVSAYEYTEIPGVLGGIDRLDQRADVPFTDLGPDPQLAEEGIDDVLLVDSQGRPAVPYRFCSDEVADVDPTCMVYDAGADPYETVQSVIDTYWHYYIYNNFRRERLGFEVEPYYWRIIDRYLWKLQWANQAYALYRADAEENFGIWAEEDNFYTRPDGMGAWTLAAAAAFQLFTRIITAPEPGDYVLYGQIDMEGAYEYEEYYEEDPDDPYTHIEIDSYEGRFLETTWDWDQGYYWFDSLERVGFFYDKVLALQLLVDQETAFVGEDTASDIRAYSLSFYNTFGPSLTAFMGGILSENWTNIAPQPSDDGVLLYPGPDDMIEGFREEIDYPIDPNADFTLQLYAAAYSMSMIPQSYSRDYINQTRLFARGGAEGLEIGPPPDCEDCDPADYVVEFHDPFSDMSYVAASYPDEDGDETGIAARMLIHAQNLYDAWQDEIAAEEAGDEEAYPEYYEWELDQYIDTIDMMRTLTWELGFGV